MAAYGALTTYLAELVALKRAAPGEDILSDLARDDDLTVEELIGIAFLLLLAGHETTANMLALGAFALLEHPEQLAELRADPELMSDAVEELTRYLAVADIFYRYATEDIELGGETIGKGSTVVVSLLAANRDPLRFDNPDAWTSTARPAVTCPSATASTCAWASNWPASRCAPASRDCCAASRISNSPSRRAR